MKAVSPASTTYQSAVDRRLSDAAVAIRDLVFPPQCVFCRREEEFARGATELCGPCSAVLSDAAAHRCGRCASACSEIDLARGDCNACRDTRLAFQEARAAGAYEADMRQAVLRAKRSAGEALAWALGQQLAAAIAARPFASPPDLIAAVPMHWLKRMGRGCNPAETLAAAIAQKLGVRHGRGLLSCRRYLRRQALLNVEDRKRNVRGAFALSRWRRLSGETVLLVDDVMTTGATAQEAAKTLLAAGAAAVCVATVARSIP